MFLEPKPKLNTPIHVKVTHESDIIFKTYGSYLGCSLDEMFVQISDKLIEDPKFIDYVKNQRFNKKISKVLDEKINSNFQEVDVDEIPFD